MNATANSKKTGSAGQTAGQGIAFLTTWLLSTAAVLTGVHTQIGRYSNNKAVLSAIIAAFALQFALYWLPGFPAIREKFEANLNRLSRAFLVGIILIIPYFIYGAGTGTLSALSIFRLIAIAAFSLGLYAIVPPDSQKIRWQDLIVMIVIALPVYSGWYRSIWSVPVYLDAMARLFVVSLMSFALLSVRPLEGVGFVWRIQTRDWAEAAKQLALFSVAGIPLGLFLKFIAWHPRHGGIPAFAFSFIGIFLFVAIAEELFFRGMLQNLLEKSFRNKYVARGIASAIFGLSHINHGFPNWRYVIMAAIAGWFYGTAWHNRRSIVASSLVHAAVDALWRQFLRVS